MLLVTLLLLRSVEISGGSEDTMVEEGGRLELECAIAGDWNLCQWKREDGAVSCLTYRNAEDEEVACEAGGIAASIVGRSDSCKVGARKIKFIWSNFIYITTST